MQPRENIPTRSDLVARLRAYDDSEAWNEFCSTYGGLIRRLAKSAGLEDHEVDDVVQSAFVSLSRNIGKFEYDRTRCSFKHWLSNMVRWRISDQIAKRLPTGDDRAPHAGEGLEEGEEMPLAVAPELEAIWDSEWRRNQIEIATQRVKKLVKAKQFQIFYLHVLHEIPVNDVSRRLGVSATQVYLAKLRVGGVFRRVLKEIQSAEMDLQA